LTRTVFYTAVSAIHLTDITPAHLTTTAMTYAVLFMTAVTNVVSLK